MSNLLALFNLGGGEILLILALILILSGAIRSSEAGEGLERFWKRKRNDGSAHWPNLITFVLLVALVMSILALFVP